MLHPVDMAFSRLLDGKSREIVLQTSAGRVFRNKDLPKLPRLFVRFVQTSLDKTVMISKSSSIVAHPILMVLLDFKKEYKKSLIQTRHCLAAFVSVETERSDGRRHEDIGGPSELVYRYCTSQVLDAEGLLQAASGTEKRKRKMWILHRSMPMVLGDVESTCTTRLRTRSKINVDLNCFPFSRPIVVISPKVNTRVGLDTTFP